MVAINNTFISLVPSFVQGKREKEEEEGKKKKIHGARCFLEDQMLIKDESDKKMLLD